MKKYFVYILSCSDNSFYTGITNDLERRFGEHQTGIDPKCYTYSRRPLKLVFNQDFADVREAISFEKQVKGWSRKKKIALIKNNWESLRELAKCKNETSHKNHRGGFDSAQPDKGSAQPDNDSA